MSMTGGRRLLFGPLAAALLLAGVVGLGVLVPGYDPVRQTVSEIGEVGSPMRLPFTVLLCAIAMCLLVFASGVRRSAIDTGRGTVSAYLIAAMAISVAGVGVFSFPHPLHNVFGLSELMGYQAPLAFALSWRKEAPMAGLVCFSWIMFALLWISIALNLSSIPGDNVIWTTIKPFYGLVQRSLFAVFFLWAAIVGWSMRRRSFRPAS